MTNDNLVFELRVKLSSGPIVIRAYEGPFVQPNHTRLWCELKQNGKVLFPRDDFYVGIPGQHCIDSDFAKETVLSLFALKPGGTDKEFFKDYTPEQLEWVDQNGDELSMVALDRYGEF